MSLSYYEIAAMLSRTAEHAIRAMVALHEHAGGGPLLAREIAAITDIPQNYLSKILHTLSRAGLLSSERGRGGGFRLNRKPEQITALDIVEQFDDVTGQRRCFLGNSVCSSDSACAIHSQWEGVWSSYEQFLKKTRLSDLAGRKSHGCATTRGATRRPRILSV